MKRIAMLCTSIMLTLFLFIPFIAEASEDADILQLLSSQEEEKSPSQQKGTSKTNKEPLQLEVKDTQEEYKQASRYSNDVHKNYLDEYMNTSVWQFYIGIRGGGAVTGTYGTLTNSSNKYAGVGAHPVLGGIIGLGIQATPNFAFRIGLSAEHLFKVKRFIAGIDKDKTDFITSGKQSIEKTSLLGEAYFDFRSGLWSAFFIKLSGGYSWVTVDGRSENGPTAGIGLGLRWYAHKYLTFDWTILDAKATFSKNISGDLGTQIGITFQY